MIDRGHRRRGIEAHHVFDISAERHVFVIVLFDFDGILTLNVINDVQFLYLKEAIADQHFSALIH